MSYEDIPPGIQSAEKVSATCRVTPERLRELAHAGLIPHYMIDGVPHFYSKEAREWVANHLMTRCDGAQSLNIIVAPPFPRAKDAPIALQSVPGLCEIAAQAEICGVYFLCEADEVVYVGQSINPSHRVREHRKDRKKFDRVFFLACPQSELDRVETEFILALEPALNGRTPTGGMVVPRISEPRPPHPQLVNRVKPRPISPAALDQRAKATAASVVAAAARKRKEAA